MSKLYGEMWGASPLRVTRRGHYNMGAYLRGWDFGIDVELSVVTPAVTMVKFNLNGGSHNHTRTSPTFRFQGGVNYRNLQLVLPMTELTLGETQCGL